MTLRDSGGGNLPVFPMKAAIIVPARDKADYVGACVRSVLYQNYSPLEILFSDQGSTDDTLAVIKEECSKYDGPNKVRVLQCPDVGDFGMPAMNAHHNWLNSQTDADIIIQVSADDLIHPDRAKYVIEAYEKYNPSTVHTMQEFINPDFSTNGNSRYNPDEDGWVSGRTCLMELVGGSSSLSWSHEFYDRIGGVHGQTIQDVYLPFVASQDRGMWYICVPLHAYVCHSDEKNMGLGGQMKAAKNATERTRIQELVHYQILGTLRECALTVEKIKPDWEGDDKQALLASIIAQGLAWCNIRDELTKFKIQPLMMRG